MGEQRPHFRIDARAADNPRYYIDDREVSKHDFFDTVWLGSSFGPEK